jgi:hypothetical protein
MISSNVRSRVCPGREGLVALPLHTGSMTMTEALFQLKDTIADEIRRDLIEQMRTWYAENREHYDGDPDSAVEDMLNVAEQQ